MVSAFLSYVCGLLFLPNNPEKVCLNGMRLKKEDKYQEEKDLPVKTSMSLPMLIMQSRGKKVSGVSYTRHGSIPCGRGEIWLTVKAGAEARDEADKKAEKSALIRKPCIALITERWVWETGTKSLMKKRCRKNPHRTELNQSMPSMLRWLYLDCSIMTAMSKTREHRGVNVSLPEQCQRVQTVFWRMPAGSCCVMQNPHTTK